MSQYNDDMKGAIWKNEKRETDRHPHFTGSATVAGVDYWVSAWKRDPDGNPKAPALRFDFRPKDEQRQSPARQSERFQAPPSKSAATDEVDFDSDIPF